MCSSRPLARGLFGVVVLCSLACTGGQYIDPESARELLRQDLRELAAKGPVVHGTVEFDEIPCEPALSASEAEGADVWSFVHVSTLHDVDWQSDASVWSPQDHLTVIAFRTDDIEARDGTLRVNTGERGFSALARYIGPVDPHPDASFLCSGTPLLAGDFVIVAGAEDNELLTQEEAEAAILDGRTGEVTELSQTDLVFR